MGLRQGCDVGRSRASAYATGIANSAFGTTVDNVAQTPQQTAAEIVRQIAAQQ